MTETLREKEEFSRIESENLRKSQDELAILRRKVDQHNELMTEKDRTAQVTNSLVPLRGFRLTIAVDFARRDQYAPTRARPD
jgi:hypothetical protein